MLQSVLTLHAAPGRFDDLVAEYRARGVIEAALPYGLLRGEALRTSSTPDRLIVTSLWASQADYDGWLAADDRVRVTTGVWGLLAPGVEAQVEKIEIPDDPDAASRPIDLGDRIDGDAVERLITVVA